MNFKKHISICCLALFGFWGVQAKSYYFDAVSGNDSNAGLTAESPFKSLHKIGDLSLKPGDKILLSADKLLQ